MCLIKIKGGEMKKIDITALKKMMQEKKTILDVRSDSEYEEFHFPNALHIPLQELPFRYKELSDCKEVIIHCAHGMRAEKAAQFLSTKITAEIYYVEGDIEEAR